jgi:DNA-binding transcriptional LysR family regulator
VALYSLPHFVTPLLQNSPQLELKIVHDLSRRITEEVISFKVDFGIVVNPTPHPDLVIAPLCEDKVCLWTRENPTHLQKLGPESVLIHDPDLLQTQFILKQMQKDFVFSRTIVTSSLETIAALVASGAGVGILPTRVATRIPSHRLMLLDPEAPTFADTICLVYRADRQRSPSSKKFARWITGSALKTQGVSVFPTAEAWDA